jgi:hypothetical protein
LFKSILCPEDISLPKKQEVNSGLTAIRHLNRSTDPFNKEAITGPVEMWWFVQYHGGRQRTAI